MVSVRCRNLVVVLLLGLVPGVAGAATIKQSSSGLCHPPESPWYERTTQFTPYPNLEACLASGGRLPTGVTLARAASPSTYQRGHFGHGWDDQDGDCQDSRAEALIATSTTTVRFSDAQRCRVVSGRWISPFTGNVIQNAGDIDIDHVVPLAWAWDHGADQWGRERRETFANDPLNLWPVEASLNRSKGAQGPDEWLPPAGQCQYVSRFVRIVIKYDLTPAEAPARALNQLLETCRQ